MECLWHGDTVLIVFTRPVVPGDEAIPVDDGMHTMAQCRCDDHISTAVNMSWEAGAAVRQLLDIALVNAPLVGADPDADTGCADDLIPDALVTAIRDILK